MHSIAEELARKQRQISIAEFFERNKQILGFDTSTRALLTSVKEAVDNSLDACEDAGILPDIIVEVSEFETSNSEYKVVVEDNGPGIVKKQIPHVFARLLYGSRFHSLKQSRGQQGIGISAVVLYSQLTTGRPTIVTSKIGEGFPAHAYHLVIDTKRNRPEIISDEMVHWEKKSGTRVELVVKGSYVKNRKQSIYEYLRSTAIMNPHANITFIEPDGGETIFERVTEKIPPKPREIKPHPYGIELGTFVKMAKEAKERKISSFLSNSFSSVSLQKAKTIIEKAGIDASLPPSKISLDDAKKIINAFQKVKLMAPPTDCLSPLGEILIKRGLKKETQMLSPEFISTDQRSPTVFSGTPFMVETGIVYGGNLPSDERVEILRFANRVPLLYQEGSCVITESIKKIDWRRYGLQQRGGKGIPYGPAIILVHVASVNIPFTSESKEAIAHIEEIEKEIRLSLQQCARKMKSHLAKKEKKIKAKNKFILISKILPEIARKSAETLNKPVPPIEEIIAQIMDIVWIDDSIEFVDKKTISKISIMNYKKGSQNFSLYAALPADCLLGEIKPSPEEVNERYIKWKVNIKPAEKKDFSFTLLGTEKGDFDENNLYVSGINPLYVIGAEKWEGE